MGIAKAEGEFITEMTEPGGWPDIDEVQLRLRSAALVVAACKLLGVIGAFRDNHSKIFSTGAWSGNAADVAGNSLNSRIREMEAIHRQIEKAIAWYDLVSTTVEQTKIAINGNLDEAQEKFAEIRRDPEMKPAEKDAAIQTKVASTNGLNTGLVSAAKGTIPPFANWEPPPIPNRTPVPPKTPTAESPPKTLPAKGDMSRMAPQGPSRGNTPDVPQFEAARQPLEQGSAAPGGIPGSPEEPAVGAPGAGQGTQQVAPGGPVSSTLGNGASPATTSGSNVSAPAGANSPLGAQSQGISSPTNGAASSTSSNTAGATSTGASSYSTAGQNPTPSSTNAAKPSSIQTMASQAPAPLSSPAPASAPAPAQAPVSQAAAAAPTTGGSAGGASGGAMGGGGAGAAPVASAPSGAPASPPPVPLGPPTTPAPPAPPAPGTAPAATGPGVAPMSAASAANAAAAPAPVPVSASRAERDAIAAATTAGALRRNTTGNDPLQRARHIAAALNVGVMDFGFFWVTGVTTDGTIVVANSYGLGYIPDGVHLPDTVKMASADEAIPLSERATWATYPILAIQRWAQHHDKKLRAVVATEEQFATFDPGVAKIILTADDMPDSGKMQGRNRLEVIAPGAAQQLKNVSDQSLTDLLPPAPADQEPPADDTAKLWFEVAKPLMSTSPQRGTAHLQAFVTYAEHAQVHALHRAHTATDAETQRQAIADWVYWQNLAVMISDAVNATATV